MHSTYRHQPSLRSRLGAIALSLAVLALVLLMLVRMGLVPTGSGTLGPHLAAVTFRTQAAQQTQQKKAVRTVQKREQHVATAQPRPLPQVPPKPEVVPPLHLLKLTRDEFAAADISKMARPSARNAEEGASSANSASAYGPWEGPGGARLYNAEWYREPTHAELVTYLPQRDVAGGWAMIACKTQEHFHVEDCQELAESPRGSGLARALRQAAWQFLVRPPRLDGKPVIGAWVRIRFDFTKGKQGDPAEQASG